MTVHDTYTSTFIVDSVDVMEFLNSTGNKNAQQKGTKTDEITEDFMDFGIVLGWKSLVTALQLDQIDGDLLKLVHLSNSFRVIDPALSLSQNDSIVSEAEILSIIIGPSGKTVKVKARLFKDECAFLEITSEFLFRGIFKDYTNTFKKEYPSMLVTIGSRKDFEVLTSKSWLQLERNMELAFPLVLKFRLHCTSFYGNDLKMESIMVKGTVYAIQETTSVMIGQVDYNDRNCSGNIVMEYLKRFGKSADEAFYFSSGGYSLLPNGMQANVTSPLSNVDYADASRDYNPIHVNDFFSDLAHLPGTITHGMWTSASVRRFVRIYAANNEPERIREYFATFTGMVLSGDELSTKISHIGMKQGNHVIKFEAVNQDGAKVLHGTAVVNPPRLAYLFTGQGSQEVGMGMDLYENSKVSRDIWDRGDAYMLNRYGVSLLKIVRQNPSSLTIHFGGKLGRVLKGNYQSMTRLEMIDGAAESKAVFPDITNECESYTFHHPRGLLHATQFTQPALTLAAIAAFQDMKEKQLVPEHVLFAGHR